MNEEEEKKLRAKQVLLSRLKQMEFKPKNESHPSHSESQSNFDTKNMSQKVENVKGSVRIDTEEDFKKMPYEGKAKYDNELKALNALKTENPEIPQKPKKMFFEHYDTSEPYCPNIPNNNNPSGRPPNIPPEMYEGIVVKPKRPWVYLGTENLPPVEYQQINDKSFKEIQRKHFEDNNKEEGKNKGEPKKRKKKQKGEQSDEFQSNFDMSDELEMSGESMLVSEYKTQSKQSKSKGPKSRVGKESSGFAFDDDDEMMSQGMETKKNAQKMFEEMDSDSEIEKEESSQISKRKKPANKKEKSKKQKQQSDSD